MGVQLSKRRHGRAARLAVSGAFCLLAALSLAACNGTNHRVPVASAADLGTDAKTPAVATPETADTVAVTQSATPDQVALATDQAPAEAEPEPDFPSYEAATPADPGEVMGLGRGEIEDLLGEPGLVRHEAPAEVWQYQSRGCVLDLFLYEASADYQVVYIEARTGQALGAATATCLGAVMDARRQTPTS